MITVLFCNEIRLASGTFLALTCVWVSSGLQVSLQQTFHTTIMIYAQLPWYGGQTYRSYINSELRCLISDRCLELLLCHHGLESWSIKESGSQEVRTSKASFHKLHEHPAKGCQYMYIQERQTRVAYAYTINCYSTRENVQYGPSQVIPNHQLLPTFLREEASTEMSSTRAR